MKTLKWELRKHVLHLRWLIIPYVIILGVLYLIPVPTSRTIVYGSSLDFSLTIISLVLLIITSYLVIIYPILSIIDSLVKKYCLLEKTDSRSYITIGITKLVLNMGCVLIASGLFATALEIIRKFDVTNSKYLIFELKIPFEVVLVTTAVLLPVMALLSFMIAGSIKLLRKNPLISALVVFVISVLILIQTQNLGADIAKIVQIIVIIVSFIVSSWLYDNKYEINSI